MRYFLLFLLFIASNNANAACRSPDADAGKVLYSASQNAVIFCDGSLWRLTGTAVTSAGSGGCSNPSGEERKIVYNTTHNQMMFCNGQNWVAMGPSNSSASGSSCSSPNLPEGTMIYSTTANWLQYCDGDDWVNAGQIHVKGLPTCPAGFAYIPKSPGVEFKTKGWCVSKYEMTPTDTASWTQDGTYKGWRYDSSSGSTKNISAKGGQNPITYVSRNEAEDACSNRLRAANGAVVTGGKLLTVELWNKLITDITNMPSNWSGGSVGGGYMSRGASNNDPAYTIATSSTDSFPATNNMGSPGGEYWSRTYMTSYGDYIWDIAGNVWEWFDDTHGTDGTTGWTEFTAGNYSFNGISLEPANSSWNSAKGVGKIYDANGATVGTTYAALFGGNWGYATSVGPWTSYWNGNAITSNGSSIGFRCIAPAQ